MTKSKEAKRRERERRKAEKAGKSPSISGDSTPGGGDDTARSRSHSRTRRSPSAASSVNARVNAAKGMDVRVNVKNVKSVCEPPVGVRNRFECLAGGSGVNECMETQEDTSMPAVNVCGTGNGANASVSATANPSVSVLTGGGAGRKRRRENVSESECENEIVGMNEKDVWDRVKDLGGWIREFILSEKNKVNKAGVNDVCERLDGIERIVGRLLCENANLRGRLKECKSVIETRGVVAPARSFARVTAESVNVQRPSGVNVKSVVAKPSFAVVVKGRENETSESVLNRVKSVSACETVRVKTVRCAKSGGVVIETMSEKERECLVKNDRFVNAGLSVELPKRMLPRMIVYDVPNEMTEERFMRGMYEKNLCGVVDVNEFQKSMRVVSRTSKANSPVGNIVIEVTGLVRRWLLEERRVYVEWGAYRVNEYERVNRCYGCFNYGHMLRECKSERLCYKCGKPGHKGGSCSAREECVNCSARKLPSGHSAISPECPEYKWRLERLRERVIRNG